MLLAEAFGSQLHAFIGRLTRDPSPVSDIFEETLERVFRKVDSYEPSRSAFRTWVYEQARYSVLDWYRQHRHLRDTQVDAVLETVEDPSPGVEEITNGTSRAESRAMRRALRRLTPTQRQLLWWVDVCGMRPSEVARAGLAGEIRPDQAKVYVWRARQELQKRFEQEIRSE